MRYKHTCYHLLCVWQTAENPLTYRYTIGMVAWNLTPRAAAVYSGPVRRRLEGSQACGPQLWTLYLFGAWTQAPRAGSLSCRVVAAPPKTTIKIFQICTDFHKSLRGAVLLAQQSVLPSIPKSGLTTPWKDWEIWDWGLDWDRRPHVLLDPSENDVITGGRRRDKRNVVEETWLFFSGLITPCVYQVLLLWKAESHSVTMSWKKTRAAWQQEILTFPAEKGLLWLHFSRLRCRPLATVNDSHRSKWQFLSSEGNYLALVRALSSSQSCFFNRGFSQVSSPSPLPCCLLLQSSDPAVGIPPQCRRQRCASL